MKHYEEFLIYVLYIILFITIICLLFNYRNKQVAPKQKTYSIPPESFQVRDNRVIKISSNPLSDELVLFILTEDGILKKQDTNNPINISSNLHITDICVTNNFLFGVDTYGRILHKELTNQGLNENWKELIGNFDDDLKAFSTGELNKLCEIEKSDGSDGGDTENIVLTKLSNILIELNNIINSNNNILKQYKQLLTNIRSSISDDGEIINSEKIKILDMVADNNDSDTIYLKIGIDTNDVLDAAGTKWNFLKYKPGLVGGHCISVDPYYLTYKAESIGYYPEVILSGRRVNSRIHKFVADKIIKLMIKKGIRIKSAKILILGITFKENCPDIRNTKIIGIYEELFKYGVEVDIVDPIADEKEVKREFDINLLKNPELGNYSGIILAVPHDKIIDKYKTEFKLTSNNVIFDLKAALLKEQSDARL